MKKTWFETQFSRALAAGAKRDYRKAIAILEDLAARGYADGSADPAEFARDASDDRDSGDGEGDARDERVAHPEIYLFLARSWHAERSFARAIACARAYIALAPGDGSGWFFLGRSYLAEGAFARAAHSLKKSVELNPQSIDARTLLGMAYLKGRKPTLARKVFEDALSLAPDDARLNQGYLNALFVEAIRTYKLGDAEAARQMLTFLINNDIDGVVPRVYLAHALRDLGYLPESLGQYEAAREFAPDDEALRWYPAQVLLEMGDAGKASELLAELGERVGDGELNDRALSMRIVKGHLDRGEWAQAANAARQAIRQFGGDARFHALMGEAQRNLGNGDIALNHFRRAIDLDRGNPAPWYGVLMVRLAAKDWVALGEELKRAERAGCDADSIAYYRTLVDANLDADPAAVLPLVQREVHERGAVPELIQALARTYFRLGLSELAVGWYKKALSVDPADEGSSLGYIACCEDLGDEAALRDAYRDYLASWGDNEKIREEFLRHLVSLEAWEEAADQVEELARSGAPGQYDRQLAFYRRKAGQWRQAAILYRKMLRARPDDRALLANLVFCLDRMGESASAVALMREANRIFKPEVGSLLIEGRLLARSGDLDGALAVFRGVIDRFPADERGWQEVAAIYRLQEVPEMAAMFEEKARDILQRKEKAKKKRRVGI